MALALFLLVLVGLGLAMRRRWLRAPRPASDLPRLGAGESLGGWAASELARAREITLRDPREATNIGAQVLRGCVAGRFSPHVLAATTEELEQDRPESAPRECWSDFVHVLQRFDALRFQPHAASADAAADSGSQVGPSQPSHSSKGPSAGGVLGCLDEAERFLSGAELMPERGA